MSYNANTLAGLAPSETWLGVLSNGLLAGFVAGGITIAAVLMTLKHDRDQRRRQAIDEACGRTLALTVPLDVEVYLAFTPTQETIRQRPLLDKMLPKPTGPAASQSLFDLLIALQHTAVIATRSAPEFAKILQDLYERLIGEMQVAASLRFAPGERATQLIHCILRSIAGAVGAWLREPEVFKAGKVTAESLLERAARGKEPISDDLSAD